MEVDVYDSESEHGETDEEAVDYSESDQSNTDDEMVDEEVDSDMSNSDEEIDNNNYNNIFEPGDNDSELDDVSMQQKISDELDYNS